MWLLYLRGRGVHLMLVLSALCVILSIVLPPTAPVLFRDVGADPRVVVWALPACVFPLCLNEGSCQMEALTRHPFWWRQIVVVASVVSVGLLGLVISAVVVPTLLVRQSLVASVSALTISLAAYVILGSLAAQVTTATAILASWVFGPGDGGVSVRPWAVLLGSESWLRVELLLALFAAAVLVYASGSVTARRRR